MQPLHATSVNGQAEPFLKLSSDPLKLFKVSGQHSTAVNFYQRFASKAFICEHYAPSSYDFQRVCLARAVFGPAKHALCFLGILRFCGFQFGSHKGVCRIPILCSEILASRQSSASYETRHCGSSFAPQSTTVARSMKWESLQQ